MEGLSEEAHGGVEIGSQSGEDVVHWAFSCAGEVQVGRIGPRRAVRFEDCEVDALIAVCQGVDLGEHDVVDEPGIVLPSVEVFWMMG